MENKKNSSWAIVVLIIGIPVLLYLSISNGTLQDITTDVNNTINPKNKVNVKIEKQYYNKTGLINWYYVEGIAENNSSKDFSYIQIEFSCYDKDNYLVDTVFATSSSLKANEKWKFETIPSTNENIKTCKFNDISAW